jgi:hypothetical protein
MEKEAFSGVGGPGADQMNRRVARKHAMSTAVTTLGSWVRTFRRDCVDGVTRRRRGGAWCGCG